MIVRIPESIRKGKQGRPHSVDSQLVSSIDFGPTVLNLAGIDVPGHMQGRAFLGGKLGARGDVYGARDRMDERYDIIRMVRDSRFRYIRNYEPLAVLPIHEHAGKGATMKEIRRLEKAVACRRGAAFSAGRKPVEELYDLENDPHEVNNLASKPEHANRLKTMREAHYRWVRETRDIGLLPEPEIIAREKMHGARYDILRQDGSTAVMIDWAKPPRWLPPARPRSQGCSQRWMIPMPRCVTGVRPAWATSPREPLSSQARCARRLAIHLRACVSRLVVRWHEWASRRTRYPR